MTRAPKNKKKKDDDDRPRIEFNDKVNERANGGALKERGRHEQGEAVPLLVL